MTFWKTKSFKELQKAWYVRLEEEGFQDVELHSGNELFLKRYSFSIVDKRCKDWPLRCRQLREVYYALLSAKVHDAVFRNEVDELILVLYANGTKIKIIAEELEKLGKRRCRNAIRFIIRRYEVAWGIREYTPQQMNKYIPA